jgi:hypothetical protein
MTSIAQPNEGLQISLPSDIGSIVDASRLSPMEWMRMRRAARDTRRAEAQRQRVAQRLDALGRNWRILDLQASDAGKGLSFLAVGPSGIYAVTIKDHGRSRVSFAGDVVQIEGRRPKYVTEARASAERASGALSRAAGISIPVMPVLAFAGSGLIQFYGMPKGCLVTSYEELGKVLNSRGQRLASSTVEKLYAVATHPATWINNPYVPLADRYRWYPEESDPTGGTGPDNGARRG